MARVGIGLPTYNGASCILEGLESLQRQTFTDFEVYISDNGSTDGTSDICADFARRDKRFHHVRFAETVPAGANFIRARDLTSSDYFMWRADDDLAEPGHLEGLVTGLDTNPSARLAVAPILRINEQQNERIFPLPIVDAENKVERIRQLLLGCHPSWFYGLWRRDAAVRDWDRVLKEYRYLWASDHLAMLPAIFAEELVLVDGANFIQRIQKVGAYHLQPDKMLAARKEYLAIASLMMREHEWTAPQMAYMNETLRLHVEKRVANKSKNIRRMWKRRVAALFGVSRGDRRG